ncbi:leucine-rich repeat domain-containing protein [Chaetoceros tenuissimus]|uniref:Leucine-rich repeat domain-containing protein n=1 Tax=Chaetoceros tenuissimus TaxID=426638 RepID=A0AAD3D3E6_9STRA|nr:leucine-rich repeat domain-containing protein [Chaetoceros tenuissimus]
MLVISKEFKRDQPPGVRMFKGKKTYFYNGEKLWDEERGLLIYDKEERNTWQVIIVLHGVKVIPTGTFRECKNVLMVMMSDTVKRIEEEAFYRCTRLVKVRLSRKLEFIGLFAFNQCIYLRSIFIPPSCKKIRNLAFGNCNKLLIFVVSKNTELEKLALSDTPLRDAFPLVDGYETVERLNDWVKNLYIENEENELHRACASCHPMLDIIYSLVKRKGIQAMNTPNEIDITPSEYLRTNPYTNIKEQMILKKYVLEMMGEVTPEVEPKLDLESIADDLNEGEILIVNVPSGKLGAVWSSSEDEKVYIREIKETCSIKDEVRVNDRLIGLDDVDVRNMNKSRIMKLIIGKSENEARKLTVLRKLN